MPEPEISRAIDPELPRRKKLPMWCLRLVLVALMLAVLLAHYIPSGP